jgi:hypothetical protein
VGLAGGVLASVGEASEGASEVDIALGGA